MKALLKHLFLNLILLWMISGIVDSITYGSFMQLAIAAGILWLLQLLVLPVLVILFMPIQLLSFGTLKWVPGIITLYIFKWLSTGYSIQPATIPSVVTGSTQWPEIHLGMFSTFILFALLYHWLRKFIEWLIK